MKKEKIIEKLEDILTEANKQSSNVPENLKQCAMVGALRGLIQAYINELSEEIKKENKYVDTDADKLGLIKDLSTKSPYVYASSSCISLDGTPFELVSLLCSLIGELDNYGIDLDYYRDYFDFLAKESENDDED